MMPSACLSRMPDVRRRPRYTNRSTRKSMNSSSWVREDELEKYIFSSKCLHWDGGNDVSFMGFSLSILCRNCIFAEQEDLAISPGICL